MLDLTPSQVAEALGVSVTPGTATEDLPSHITTVVTDSRDVTRGSLFIAIEGERVDGHDFLAAAFDSGAAAAIVTREVSSLAGPSIVVDDAVAGGVAVTPGTATEDLPSHITTVVTDSRDVTRGSLFIAIEGERVDGHDFLAAAFDSGAAAAIVTREVSSLAGPSIVVDDAVA